MMTDRVKELPRWIVLMRVRAAPIGPLLLEKPEAASSSSSTIVSICQPDKPVSQLLQQCSQFDGCCVHLLASQASKSVQ